jgi:NSS family neurotransmitter:Na+ symporter
VENKNMTRFKACLLSGVITWALGIICALSFNLLDDFKILGKTFFDLLDFLTANILLPAGGFLIAIFVGWVMKQQYSRAELQLTAISSWYRVWLFLVRFVAPLAVVLVFLHSIGVLKLIGLDDA